MVGGGREVKQTRQPRCLISSAPGAPEARDGWGRMETHRWVARGSLGWGDGDASSPGQLGSPLGRCRTLHWEIGHPTWGLGQMEHSETRSGQIFACPSPCLSLPLCGKEKKDL